MRKTIPELTFTAETLKGDRDLILVCRKVYIIGYSGRDTDTVRRHIEELQAQLGVAPPAHIPEIYECGTELLSSGGIIPDAGGRTSGEVEYVMLVHDGRLYIGIGSDHTDRDLESSDVPEAKRRCGKPVGRKFWPFNELEDHWDRVILRSWTPAACGEIPYQEGTAEAIRRPEELLEILTERVGSVEDCLIFSGTVPLLGGYRFDPGMRCELEDPVLGRTLGLIYVTEGKGT